MYIYVLYALLLFFIDVFKLKCYIEMSRIAIGNILYSFVTIEMNGIVHINYVRCFS